MTAIAITVHIFIVAIKKNGTRYPWHFTVITMDRLRVS